MWPLTAGSPEWPELLCRHSQESQPDRGHLSDDPRVEAFLQILLVFGPTAWLLIGAPFVVVWSYGAEIVVLPNRRGVPKTVIALVLLALESTSVVTSALETPHNNISIALLLSLSTSVAVCALSFLEHGRNPGPSTLLTSYLFMTLFRDIIQVGLVYVAWGLCSADILACVSFATRLILFVLECQTKRSILRMPFDQLSPEETAGVFGRAAFWWVNGIIKTGCSSTLSLEHMPALGASLDVTKARAAIQRQWDARSKPEGQFSLLWALSKCLLWPSLYVVFPRTSFVVLNYCQPLLISRAITYASSDLTAFETRNEGFRLILFAFIIYAGMPMFSSIYHRLLFRLDILIRMKLIGLIYNRSLTIKDGVFDESVAVTLMSDDAGGAANYGDVLHDLWAEVLGLGIGMYMLAGELGWVCILPILVALAASKIVSAATEDIGSRQMEYRMGTQTRIAATKDMLYSIRTIKMMGIVDKIEANIQATRDQELVHFKGFYRLLVAFFASAVGVNLLAPATTLVIYAIQAEIRGTKEIDVNMAFTTMAITDLIVTPINALLGVIPEAAAAMAAFDRIQAYLLSPDRGDRREYLCERNADAALDHVSVNIDNATVRPASTADPVLKNISAVLTEGNLVAVSGAVGTGKTTLAKAILGDPPPDDGVIQTASGTIAYCSQTAWLTNGTIREAICGPPGNSHVLDEEWYNKVVHACDLGPDLDQMTLRDQTVVGSRGTTLSGGQKQRVALARAVYARQSLIILDDVLSALDATTERHIVKHLLGPEGLLKELGTTALLITHTTQHLPLADHIIVLDEKGEIAEQGTWEDLRAGSGHISKTILKEEREDENKRPFESREAPPDMPDPSMQDLTRRTGDITLYGYYFSAIGLSRLFLLLASLTLYAVFLGSLPYWLKWLGENHGQQAWFYIGNYFSLTLAAFAALTVSITTIFLVVAPHSSNTLHARMLRTVMHAPQSFFSASGTDTGTILNRFSSDIMMIDRQLPFATFQVFQAIFRLVSQCTLLAIVQPLITVTLPFTAVAVYVVQTVYLATSRQLRFLDLEARALVNASFLETLEGVATIRAFGWQPDFVADNARKLDMSLRPDYLLECIQQWLNVVLDLMVAGLAIGVIGLAVALKGTTTGGQVGIALNVILLANNYLMSLVQAGTKLETSLGAVARVRSFEHDVQPEDKADGSITPSVGWPSRGAVEFDHLSVSYTPPTLALNNITVSVAPGIKVGVVGRTGSGKSTLLLSLLRLVEFEGGPDGAGTIRIDGLDVRDLQRNAIRSRVITVPQDAMLIMTDTVRQNLDISDAGISDEDMIDVLERVRLWDVFRARVTSAEAAGREAHEVDASMGLACNADGNDNDNTDEATPLVAVDDEDGDDGNNGSRTGTTWESKTSPTAILGTAMKSLPLSQGQQQLFSLARALLMRLSRGNLVLLDEATSSVDSETDKLMQELVREEFKEHTVITIAHRLDTIMDSDVVLVLDKAKLVEVGPPSELAEKAGGAFRALIHGNTDV